MAYALAWEHYSCQNLSSSPPIHSTNLESWTPPLSQWWKINTDASWIDASSYCDIAGVIRDAQGNWVKGFYKKVLCISALMGELLAILESLRMMHVDPMQNLFILNSDCQAAVTAIHEEDRGRDANYHVITECRDLLQSMMGSRIEYANRATNRVADAMAKISRTSSLEPIITHFVTDPPLEIRSLYYEDKPP